MGNLQSGPLESALCLEENVHFTSDLTAWFQKNTASLRAAHPVFAAILGEGREAGRQEQ
jgi:hypothetical protein